MKPAIISTRRSCGSASRAGRIASVEAVTAPASAARTPGGERAARNRVARRRNSFALAWTLWRSVAGSGT